MAVKKSVATTDVKPKSKRTKSAAPAEVVAEFAPVEVAPVEAAPSLPAVVEPAPIARAQPTHAAVSLRAAQIYSERGGSAFDNWIQAERELGA
jgi:hypothetical protein